MIDDASMTWFRLRERESKFEPGAEVIVHDPENFPNAFCKVMRAVLSPAGSSWNIAVELPG